MEKFTGESILEFTDKFKTDLDCLEYLAEIKWKAGFKCVKCNHTNSLFAKRILQGIVTLAIILKVQL